MEYVTSDQGEAVLFSLFLHSWKAKSTIERARLHGIPHTVYVITIIVINIILHHVPRFMMSSRFIEILILAHAQTVCTRPYFFHPHAKRAKNRDLGLPLRMPSNAPRNYVQTYSYSMDPSPYTVKTEAY